MIDATINNAILDILAELPNGKALDTATLAVQTNANTKFAVDYAMTTEHCSYLLKNGYLLRQPHPLDPNKTLWSITTAGLSMSTQF